MRSRVAHFHFRSVTIYTPYLYFQPDKSQHIITVISAIVSLLLPPTSRTAEPRLFATFGRLSFYGRSSGKRLRSLITDQEPPRI
mmetsp:Transcript_7703/g.23067  ORF Transcript_7703/g.23067 Transcript_7703/m.23067 type:complete len:84 (-) Transcript_7703:141-392(-)